MARSARAGWVPSPFPDPVDLDPQPAKLLLVGVVAAAAASACLCLNIAFVRSLARVGVNSGARFLPEAPENGARPTLPRG